MCTATMHTPCIKTYFGGRHIVISLESQMIISSPPFVYMHIAKTVSLVVKNNKSSCVWRRRRLLESYECVTKTIIY